MIFSSGESLAAPAVPTPAAAKLYATLFSGPPMSKAIIRPRIAPRMMALPLLSELSPSASRSISQLIGRPKTISIRAPAMTVLTSGITMTGIRPRAHDGTVQPPTQ